MADPIPLLNLVPKAQVPRIVTYLKQLLAAAEAGDLQALAVVTRTREGEFDTWWCHGDFQDFGLAAGIARLGWRYQAEAFSDAERSPVPPDDGA